MNNILTINELEDIIGYRFNNSKLLEQALTHKSFGKNNNERLEFLGDSVLGAVIANHLFTKFSGIDEGRLTRFKSYLVGGKMLTEIGLRLNVVKYLKLGSSEKKNTKINASIIENAVESLFGAIFLDSNFIVVSKVIIKIYKQKLDSLDISTNLKDSKTNLQELLQKHNKMLPVYSVIDIKGKDHDPIFVVKAQLLDYKISTVQQGGSIKIAQQKCAEVLINRLRDIVG